MDVSLRRDKDSLQGTGEPLVDFQKGRDTNWFLYQGSLENSANECASTDAGTNNVFEKMFLKCKYWYKEAYRGRQIFKLFLGMSCPSRLMTEQTH